MKLIKRSNLRTLLCVTAMAVALGSCEKESEVLETNASQFEDEVSSEKPKKNICNLDFTDHLGWKFVIVNNKGERKVRKVDNDAHFKNLRSVSYSVVDVDLKKPFFKSGVKFFKIETEKKLPKDIITNGGVYAVGILPDRTSQDAPRDVIFKKGKKVDLKFNIAKRFSKTGGIMQMNFTLRNKKCAKFLK